MKSPRHRMRNWSRDEGIAMILTIGILSLMLIMAVSFVTASKFSLYTSELHSSTLENQLYTETGLQEVLAKLFDDFGNPTEETNLFPATKSGQSDFFTYGGRYFWHSVNSDDTDGIDTAFYVTTAGVDFTPNLTVSWLPASAGWLHIQSTVDSTILGRIAYLIIDESGKIDPGAVVSSTINEGDEDKFGRTVEEIDLKEALDDADLATAMQPDDNSGDMPAGLEWFSHYNMFNTSSEAVANADLVLTTLFPYSYDIEAFFDLDTEIDLHRFDLANADWDGFGNSVAASGIDNYNVKFWGSNGTVAANTGGIGWFYYCDSAVQKNQVIANIIDYCDADSIPTADDDDNPTYVGAEIVPLFNEFYLDADITDNGPNWDFQLVVEPEFVNIYETDFDDDFTVRITVNVHSTDLPTNPTTLTYSWAVSAATVSAETYYSPGSLSQSIDNIGVDTLTNVQLEVTAALIKDNSGNILDFAKTDVGTTLASITESDTPWIVAAETNDPRNNHDTGDWTFTDWDPVFAGTLASVNSICIPNPGGEKDWETTNGVTSVTQPWEVSTAYIRNGTMQSLWELGAIHRGATWETIRLSKFSLAATSILDGLGAYSDGDANILEQVKLSSDTIAIRGRINPNTYSQNVLRGILVNLRVGGTYASPDPGVLGIIDQSTADELIGPGAGTWLTENGTSGASPLDQRGAIAEISKLSDSTTIPFINDRSQEEIIGKTVHLMTIRHNVYTVIVAAQTINDLPTGVKGGTLGVYDVDTDEIIAEQRVLLIIHRDTQSSITRLLRWEYLD